MSVRVTLDDVKARLSAYMDIRPRQPILDFVAVGSLAGLGGEYAPVDFTLSPFLKDPLQAAADFTGRHKTVAVMAVEQTGKSLIWQLFSAWAVGNVPGTQLVVYQNDEVAEQCNYTKYIPLLQGVPGYRHMLTKYRTLLKDRILLNGSTI